MTTQSENHQPAFHLKGSVLTVSVLQILTLDYDILQQQLESTLQKNTTFFKHMPIVIDLQKIYNLDIEINFVELTALLRHHELVPVGVTNGNKSQITSAIEAGLGVLPNIKTGQAPKNASKKVDRSKVITLPVRSGQQIYAKNADLVILASVGNGAEILADGNIHVYGTLRGRAIAGVNGDKSARIFCHKLEAELVSIAGYYKLHDDISTQENMSGTHIFLEEEQLVISPIG